MIQTKPWARRMVPGLVSAIAALAHAGALPALTPPVPAVQSSSSPSPANGAEPAGAHGRYAGMARIAGEVTAVKGSTLVLKTPQGQAAEVITTENTRVMKERGPVRLADVHAGDGVMAVGNLDGAGALHAAVVFAEDAAQVKALRENLGKTYITGRVKSVDLDDARLTVERGDHVVQTIGLDEGTSFRRAVRGSSGSGGTGGSGNGGEGQGRGPGGGGAGFGAGGMGMGGMALGQAMERGFEHGESITLADVKAGDFISATGGLKGGVFVPTKLLDLPGGMHHPRSGAGTAPGNGNPGSAGLSMGPED